MSDREKTEEGNIGSGEGARGFFLAPLPRLRERGRKEENREGRESQTRKEHESVSSLFLSESNAHAALFKMGYDKFFPQPCQKKTSKKNE